MSKALTVAAPAGKHETFELDQIKKHIKGCRMLSINQSIY
jgi:hypothetical protein